jgi:hypothetical protein
MADLAAHLVDRVIPDVPVRQWVLSFPFELRFRLARVAGEKFPQESGGGRIFGKRRPVDRVASVGRPVVAGGSAGLRR